MNIVSDVKKLQRKTGRRINKTLQKGFLKVKKLQRNELERELIKHYKWLSKSTVHVGIFQTFCIFSKCKFLSKTLIQKNHTMGQIFSKIILEVIEQNVWMGQIGKLENIYIVCREVI